jgi:hypothetical protein
MLHNVILDWGKSYTLLDLIDGPPYGTTRVYREGSPTGPGDVPSVSVYLPTERRWIRRLGPPFSPESSQVDPLRMRLTVKESSIAITAASTRRLTLPQGIYVVTASLPPSTSPSYRPQPCFVAGTASLSVDKVQEAQGFGFPLGPCLPGESAATFIVHHRGGDFYVSWIGPRPTADLPAVVVRRVLEESSKEEGVPLPPLSAWTLVTTGSRTPGETADRFVGDRSLMGYQLVSPSIPALSDARGKVVLDVVSESGGVQVGVLGNGGQRWLATPKTGREIPFDASGASDIQVVVLAANPTEPAEPVRFRVRHDGRLVLERAGRGAYVYELTACLRPLHGILPDYCDPTVMPSVHFYQGR